MKHFERGFDRTLTFIERAIFYFVAALIIIVSAIVCVEIISRNLFGHSFVFVEELTMILLGWIAFFSAAYAMRKRAHVAVDFLYGKMPAPARKALYAVTYIVGIVFMLYIVNASWSFANMQMKIPLTLSRLPRGYISMGLPFGASCITLFMVTDLIETFVLRRDRSIRTTMEQTNIDLEATMVQGAQQSGASDPKV